MTLVLVEWLDSHVDSDWREVDQIRKTAEQENALLNHTAGHLVLDEDDYLLVASTETPSSDETLYGNTTQIPRVAVRRIRSLEIGRTRSRR